MWNGVIKYPATNGGKIIYNNQQSVVTKPKYPPPQPGRFRPPPPPPPSPFASHFKYFMVHAQKILSSSSVFEVEIFP